MAKILVVDDEIEILDFIQYNLEKEGFEVIIGKNGDEAISLAKKYLPDLILLDIMMPEKNGIEACEAIRKVPTLKKTLIAFLTALDDEQSELKGFESGADEYISKPIKPRILISRINALLRRSNVDATTAKLDFGEIMIDKEKYQVYLKNTPIELARKEFELLYLLASKPGRVFLRNEILSKIWGDDVYVGDRTIDVHIRKIRSKLGDDVIKTIKGVGYKFEYA
jgi:two-component system, OmpR family, alkaline phosphatase synthesis response regulator PhoP